MTRFATHVATSGEDRGLRLWLWGALPKGLAQHAQPPSSLCLYITKASLMSTRAPRISLTLVALKVDDPVKNLSLTEK